MKTLLALILAICCMACGIETPSANFENFSGTVDVRGIWSHPFHVDCRSCEISAQLISSSPDSASIVTLGLTLQSNGVCQGVITSMLAGGNQNSLPYLATQSDYCVFVADAGYLTRAQSVTVKVQHP